MRDFTIRIASIFFAIPCMLVISFAIEHFSKDVPPIIEEGVVDLSGSVIMQFIAISVYAFPVYLVVGVPVSYLVDYISSRFSKRFHISSYLLNLCLYLGICLIMIVLFIKRENFFTLDPVKLIVVPVLCYFHVLYFLKQKFKTA